MQTKVFIDGSEGTEPQDFGYTNDLKIGKIFRFLP